jgi:hypothetical protein
VLMAALGQQAFRPPPGLCAEATCNRSKPMSSPATVSTDLVSDVECTSSEDGGTEDGVALVINASSEDGGAGDEVALVMDPGPPPGLDPIAVADTGCVVKQGTFHPWKQKLTQAEQFIAEHIKDIARILFHMDFSNARSKVCLMPNTGARAVNVEIHLAKAAIATRHCLLEVLQGALIQQLPPRNCQVFRIERAPESHQLSVCCAQVTKDTCWQAMQQGGCPRGVCCTWEHPKKLDMTISVMEDAVPADIAATLRSSQLQRSAAVPMESEAAAWYGWAPNSAIAPTWFAEWGNQMAVKDAQPQVATYQPQPQPLIWGQSSLIFAAAPDYCLEIFAHSASSGQTLRAEWPGTRSSFLSTDMSQY